MSGAQFKHIETYGRKASKRASCRWSAQDIADEAERKPSACHHVKEPKPPALLYGVMPNAAVKRAHEWAAQAKDVRGSKLREDGLCIVAGVVSAPPGFQLWEPYRDASIENLKMLHGDRLLSVVEHTDEAYAHIHFYLVPRDGETVDDIHVGIKARNTVKYAKQKTGDQNAAYIAAMQKFQDDHHEQVASKFGLTRFGPKRERLSRQEWEAQKAAAELTAQMTEAANARAQQILMDAMTNAEGQGAAYFAQVKAEAEKIKADNLMACEVMTKNAMDQAKAETQAAAVAKAEARKEKDEAAIKLAEAEASGAEYRAKLIAGGEAYIARETARGKSLIAAAEAKAKAEARYGDKAEAIAELEARHRTERLKDEALIKSHHSAAVEAKQVASVEKQHGDLAQQALVAEKEKTAKLEQRVRELERPQQRTQQRQDNAPVPKM